MSILAGGKIPVYIAFIQHMFLICVNTMTYDMLNFVKP